MHRRRQRQARQRRRARWLAGPLTLIITTVAVMAPATSAVLAPSALVTAAPPAGAVAVAAAAVGALFSTSRGRLSTHFCTASVVDSPAGDLLVTAAHCVTGYSDPAPAGLAFVPGYDNGKAPYGVWTVTRIFVDRAWETASNPDDDVAFLTVAQPGGDTPIENVTGGERLGIGQPSTGIVRVTGYPNTQNRPISCQNRTSVLSPGQMQFDCDNYTTGTSGGPFLTDMDVDAGAGMVIGVIGGYEQGGDSADVSYSATFGPDVAALYDTAVAHN